MSAGVQKTLDDDYELRADDLDESDWRSLYERYDGCLADIIRHTGLSERAVRSRLISYGIHESESREPAMLENKLPEDVGLSPLNCVECGARGIGGHPCDECGFDPRNGGAST